MFYLARILIRTIFYPLSYVVLFVCGFFAGVAYIGYSTAQEITQKEILDIVAEQELSFEKDGTYKTIIDSKTSVHTYETICQGYVIETKTPTSIEYIGYGPLSQEYTYSVPVAVSPVSATSSDSKRLFPDTPLSLSGE